MDVAALIQARKMGFSLQQPFYTDEQIFQLDLERVYYCNWLFAGHGCQIPAAGDYFTFDAGKLSLILIRGDDGSIRALPNSCRHRGSKICTQPHGHAGKFVCPYHSWVYERDGRLASARWMGDGFDKSNYSLRAAHVRVIHGLIFVCAAQNAPDFEPARRVIETYLKPHGMDRVKICHQEDHEIRANWMVIFENNRECYHCPTGHPEYCSVNYDLGMPGDQRSNAHYDQVCAEKTQHWKAMGLSTEAVNFPDGQWFRCARMPLREGCATESIDGKPVAPLMGELKSADAGSLRIIAFPNAWFHVNSDYANSTQLIPVGPGLTRSRILWFVREDAREGADYETKRVVDFWKITTEQDWRLSELNYAGISSLGYQPGPFSPMAESGVETFAQWYLRQLSTQSVRSEQSALCSHG